MLAEIDLCTNPTKAARTKEKVEKTVFTEMITAIMPSMFPAKVLEQGEESNIAKADDGAVVITEEKQ